MRKNIVIEDFTLFKTTKLFSEQLVTAMRIQKVRKAAIAALRTEATAITEEPFCGPFYSYEWEPLWDNRRQLIDCHRITGMLPVYSLVTADTWSLSKMRNVEKDVSIVCWDAYGRCPESNKTFCLFLKGDKFVGIGKLQNRGVGKLRDRMSVELTDELIDIITHGSYDAVVADMKQALNSLLTQPGRFVDPRIAKYVFGDHIGKGVRKK